MLAQTEGRRELLGGAHGEDTDSGVRGAPAPPASVLGTGEVTADRADPAPLVDFSAWLWLQCRW